MIDELCRVLVERAPIHTFVETGSFQGDTIALVSRWFSEIYPEEFGHLEKLVCDGERGTNPWNTQIAYPVWTPTPPLGEKKVITIDINAEWCHRNRRRFSTNPNVQIMEGSSEQVLQALLDGSLGMDGKAMFFLDAHWNEYWPLRDEIKQILRLPKFIMVFDDFRVPLEVGKHWGVDVHGGVECGWTSIQDLFLPHEGRLLLYYPYRSNRDNRGWAILFSGYPEGEADRILSGLPVWKGSLRQ